MRYPFAPWLAPRLHVFVSFLLVCSFASAGLAETYYVNNIAGSDTNTGVLPRSEGGNSGPVRTIQRALELVYRGDRIELANTGQPYRECLTLQGRNHSGYTNIPFTIEGNGASLDGTAMIPATRWTWIDGDLHRFEPERGGYQMLFLNGTPAKERPRFDGGYLTSFLQPLEWCRSRGGIQFMTEKGKSPFSYDLRFAKERVGITLYDVENVVIKDLRIHGYQLDGVNAHDNAMDCVFARVTSVANGRSGFAVNGASRVKMVECEAFDNGESQLRCADWSTTEVRESEFYSANRPAWTRHGLGNPAYSNQGARLIVDGARTYEVEGWQEERKQPVVSPDDETEEALEDFGDGSKNEPSGEADDEATDDEALLDAASDEADASGLEAFEDTEPATDDDMLNDDASDGGNDDPFEEFGTSDDTADDDLFGDF